MSSWYITGEYISLYHHQRALLQQRETHKNDYISQLAKDREELQVTKHHPNTLCENALFANFDLALHSVILMV